MLLGVITGFAAVVSYHYAAGSRPLGTTPTLEAVDRGVLDDDSTKIMESIDDYGRLEGGGDASHLSTHNVTKFAVRLAAEARCKFGFDLAYTVANRQMVHTWLYKRLKESNCRVVVMTAVLPRAVALTFIKAKQELDFEEELASPAMRERARLSSLPYWERWRASLLERAVSWLVPTLVPPMPQFSK